MSVKIIADSTCDLSKDLLEKYNISIVPLHIVLGEKEYRDGLEIHPDEIYQWSDTYKEAPKTSAVSIADAMDLFESSIQQYDEIVCFSISGQMSTTINVLRMAAEELELEEKIHIIDSENLSTGGGLLVMEAAIMAQNGKNAAEIKEKEKDFINSEVAQDVLVAIAEMDKEALMANEKVKDIVEKCKDNKDANKKGEETFNKSKNLRDNNTVKAENTAKKGVEDAKEKARAEILELVKQKNYNGCLEHKQFKTVLSMQERVAVENVLNYENKFKKIPKLKQAVKTYVLENVLNDREITWDLLIKASKAIQKMELNNKNGLDVMHNVQPL